MFRATSGQGGQAIAEFALLAPLVLLMMALIFTGSQYMSTVVGINGAARAGAIVASNYMTGANGTGDQVIALRRATDAVNAEQGLSCSPGPCFTGVANQASCAPTASAPGCVWVDANTTAPSSRHLETVHVSYQVTSFISFVQALNVVAISGAEYR